MNTCTRGRCWFWCLLILFLGYCANLLVLPRIAFAQNNVTAKSTFTDLDDEAEVGGYEVSAQITDLPVEWSLARHKNGDGYLVDLTSDAISLSIQSAGKKILLARSAGEFAASKVSPVVVILQRNTNRWNIIWQNRVVLRAEDDRFDEGAIGWKGSAGAVLDAKVQPTETPFFDDDFMRVSEDAAYEQAKPNPRNGMVIRSIKVEETIWGTVAGKWKTTGVSENDQAQVAESANPFAFESGAKDENLALAGRPFWSDYSVEAAVKPQGASALGLVLYAQDAQNYLMFLWKEDGEVQLCSVIGGKTIILSGSTYQPYGINQWYSLECRMHGGVWRAYIDGQQVLRTSTGWFGQGRIGVYSLNPDADKNSVFDDVHVRATQDVLDDFSLPVPGRWQTVTGNWNWQKSASPQGSALAIAAMGEKSWSNYGIDSSAFLPGDGMLGLIVDETDKGKYLFRITGSKAKTPDAGSAQLILMQGKTSRTLEQIKTGTKFDNKTALWSFEEDQGYLKVTAGEEKTLLLEAYDETLQVGRPGIYAKNGAKAVARFDGVLVHFPEQRQVWAKIPELYVDPRQAETMGAWSTPQGSWIPAEPTSAKPDQSPATSTADAKTLWNKGLFWGDGDVSFKMPALGKDQKMFLLLGDASRPDDAKSTFTLELQADAGTLNAQLLQDGLDDAQTPASRMLASAQTPFKDKLEGQVLHVSHRGSFFIVRLGENNPHAFLIYQQKRDE